MDGKHVFVCSCGLDRSFPKIRVSCISEPATPSSEIYFELKALVQTQVIIKSEICD